MRRVNSKAVVQAALLFAQCRARRGESVLLGLPVSLLSTAIRRCREFPIGICVARLSARYTWDTSGRGLEQGGDVYFVLVLGEREGSFVEY